MAKQPATNVSKQVQPISLQRPWTTSTRVRRGSLNSGQMRRLAGEGIPAIVLTTLIDQAIGGLEWEIINPSGGKDQQTEFTSLVLHRANDGEGASPFFIRFAKDILTTIEGGFFDISF